ncbi:MAG: hypothetical protein JNK14_20685 [Chitinophagaceae bacterium]|nr:hypothetical protein [Chitinophagaceae bacterium]
MPSKKPKKNAPKKSAAKKKAAKKIAAKKAVPKKKAVKKKAVKKSRFSTSPPEPAISRGGIPCICIENNEGWFCMRRLPNGELKECDGPFDTKEECESHVCR